MFTNDESIARELVLLSDNDYQIYRQRVEPIMTNLDRKIAKGIYNSPQAVKLVRYLIDDVARKYSQHYTAGKWYKMFTPVIRNMAAEIWIDEHINNNRYGDIV